MKNQIHITKYGMHHPAPNSEVAWIVNDVRGYADIGPQCDECGACECPPLEYGVCECGEDCNEIHCVGCGVCECGEDCDETHCVGLSFAYVCLDGGDALCDECFQKDTSVEVVECDC